MTIKTENLHIVEQYPLPSPAELKLIHAARPDDEDAVASARKSVQDILDGVDSRSLLILGPCSIHDTTDALAYAERLKGLAAEVSDVYLLIMRSYFEKPRTTIGWKGLIYDPGLNGACDIPQGIAMARKLLLDLVEMGLPVATEVLDPVLIQYTADLVSWAAIGARTTESQTHRQLASGLSMPVGFKNATDGGVKVAVEAVKTARSQHTFLGVLDDGRTGVFKTGGNPYSHLILRGGANGPNYGSEHVAYAKELMRKSKVPANIIVDCSHGNSGKDPARQVDVMMDAVEQIRSGERVIAGVMLESNMLTGRQDCPAAGGRLTPGLSITDACLGWTETRQAVLETADMLRSTKKKLP